MEFTLQIEKLGLVENSEITLKPFTLIYGDNNLNKSYTLLAFFFVQKLLTSTEITWMEQRNPILNEKDLKQFEVSKEEAKKYIKNLKNLNQKLVEFINDSLKKSNNIYLVNLSKFEKFLNEKIKTLLPSFYSDMISIAAETLENWNIKVRFSDIEKKELLIFPLAEDYFFILRKNQNEKVEFIHTGFATIQVEISLKRNVKQKINIKSNDKENINFYKNLYNVIVDQLFDIPSAKFLPPSRGCVSDFSKVLAILPFFETAKKVIPGLYRDLIIELFGFPPIGIDNKKAKKGVNIFKKLFEFEAIQTREGIKFKDLRWNIEGDITFASSSIKELAPIYRLLDKGFSGSLYIEEPELHLHPKNQIKMAMFLSALTNIGYNIAITTHSDFLVSMLGKLIALKILKDKDSKLFEEVKKKLPITVEEDYLLDPKKVGVYWFKPKKGKVEIEKVPIGQRGIPLKAFREAVENLYEISGLLEEIEDEY